MRGAFRSFIAGALAFVGIGAGHTAAAASNSSRVVAVAKASQDTSREIEADRVGGVLRGLMRDTGTPPDVWGRSRACARMVARNRGIKAGGRR